MCDMQLNTELIRNLREERAWSQEHLASVTGLSVRTIQRLETLGKASHESRLALAAAFGVPPAELLAGQGAVVAEAAGGEVASAEVTNSEAAGAEKAAGGWPAWLDLSQRDVRLAVTLAAVAASAFFIYRFGEGMGQFLYYLTH